MKQRPTGVLVCAISLGLAVLALVLMAVITVIGSFVAPHMPQTTSPMGGPQPSPGMLAALTLFIALIYFAMAGWAGSTLWGLLRMRPWARVSAMVLGGGLGLLGLLMALGCLAARTMVPSMPLPPGADARTLSAVFLVSAFFGLLVTAGGIAFLVYFAARRTREAFLEAGLREEQLRKSAPYDSANSTSPVTDFTFAQTSSSSPDERHTPPAEPSIFSRLSERPASSPGSAVRPVSVTIVAVLLLVGSFGSFMAMFSPSPLFLFGVALSGWPAHVSMLMFCAVRGVAGLGLLKLQKPAWVLAVGALSVNVLNALISMLPGTHARYAAYLHSLLQNSPSGGFPFASYNPNLVSYMLVAGGLLNLLYDSVLLFLLWRARGAFQAPATEGAAG